MMKIWDGFRNKIVGIYNMLLHCLRGERADDGVNGESQYKYKGN
jgi:hypothetical protein